MCGPLRLLLIEDSEDDARLLLRELQRAGYDVTHERVETEADLAEALDRGAWDLIVSDYALPAFDAPTALGLVAARGGDVPFLIVSGSVGEEEAVAAMRAGARDFISKGKLTRLAPVVARELHEAAGRVERKRMEAQLLVSDRMASLGTLAAGVAHEINNPLAAVLANVEYVLDVLVADDAAPELIAPLREALEAAERVRRVALDLRVFSRGDEPRQGPIDLHSVLDSSLRMARNEIRHRAYLICEYGDVPPVQGDDTRLGQLFLNLLVNAAQSMPDGGVRENELRVITRRASADLVQVEIRDTGPGIPDDVLPHIFEPFFSTKPVGVGTGLGLAICERVVTSLGGEITVETSLGSGTAFVVSLPISANGHPAVSAPVPGTPQVGRRGRVLAIDDDLLVGAALKRTLGRDHDVVVVDRAAAGLHLITTGEEFDVILCDLLMPEQTGMELYGHLRVVAPQQAARMVFMTGGAFTPAARDFVDHVELPVLDKPFDVSLLRTTVQAMIR